MLKTILLFFIAIVGVLASHLLVGHQGHVLIQTTGHNIQMSITLLVSLIILIYFVLTLLWRCTMQILQSPKITLGWLKQRRTKRAQQDFEIIIQQLVMQNHLAARHSLQHYATQHPNTALALLLSAANELNLQQYATATALLRQAKAITKKSEQPLLAYLAIRSALEQQHYATLERLLEPWLKVATPSAVFLNLALRYYNATQQYDLAVEIATKLQKQLQWSEHDYQQLQQQLHCSWMRDLLKTQGVEPLLNWWSKQKKAITQQPELQTLLAKLCLQAGAPELSEKFIIKYNQTKLNIELLTLSIGQPLVSPEKISALLQKKLQTHPEDLRLKRLLAYSLSAEQQYTAALPLLLESVARYPNASDYWQLTQIYQAQQRTADQQASRELTLQCYLEGKSDFQTLYETSTGDHYKKSSYNTLNDDTQK